MKFLLVLIGLAVGAIVYPRYAEHTDDVCGALGKRLSQLAAGRPALPQMSWLDLAKSTTAARFPGVPEVIRCTVGYWLLVADPEVADITKRLGPPK